MCQAVAVTPLPEMDSHSLFSVTFNNLSYSLPEKRDSIIKKALPPLQILKDVSGHVSPGESLAILGPSGAGKSTLLNLLAARTPNPPSSGKILFSGRPRLPRTKRYIGYVMQDDVFFSKLTVRQTLTFTADVRLPRSMTPQQRTARVDQVISKLGLEKCQHTIVGDAFDRGISGGERKRLNIANELIHEPSLFLADECTTGLDSSSALNVLNVLEGLCEEQRTVIVTIHQPSSRMFVMFSKILLLAAGRVAYFGKPDKMKRYLQNLEFPFPSSNYNPAEYALELLMDTESVDGNPSTQARILEAWSTSRKDDSDKMSESKVDDGEGPSDKEGPSDNDGSVMVQVNTDASLPKDTIYGRKPPTNYYARFIRALSKRMQCISGVDSNEAPKYKVGWWQQTRALMRRTIQQKQGLLLQAPAIAQLILTVIMTAAFWFRVPPKEGRIEDRLGLIAFYAVNWGFYAMNSSIFAFPPERKVLQKDRANGVYRLSCYYFAKSMVELPADTLYPLFSSVIIYYLTGLNPDIRAFVLFNVIMVLNCWTAHSIALFLSALFMNIRRAQLAGQLLVIFSLLMSGYLLDPGNFPNSLRFFRDLSFLRYTYDALLRVEFSFGHTYDCAESDELLTIYSGNGAVCPVDMKSVLAGANNENSLPIWGGILMHCGWILGFRILGFCALKVLHTTHKPNLSSWKSN